MLICWNVCVIWSEKLGRTRPDQKARNIFLKNINLISSLISSIAFVIESNDGKWKHDNDDQAYIARSNRFSSAWMHSKIYRKRINILSQSVVLCHMIYNHTHTFAFEKSVFFLLDHSEIINRILLHCGLCRIVDWLTVVRARAFLSLSHRSVFIDCFHKS